MNNINERVRNSNPPALPRPVAMTSSITLYLGRGMSLTALLAMFLQVAILGGSLNFFCGLFCFVGTVLFHGFILRSDVVTRHPVSCFTLFGAVVTMLWGPLIFTTLEWKPIIYELKLPVQTFGYSLALCAALIAAHVLYRKLGFGRFAEGVVSNLWGRHGFFNRPSALMLWIMGFVGLAAFFYLNVIKQEDMYTIGVQGSVAKFISGLAPFAYAPLVLLALPFLSPRDQLVNRFHVVCCILYIGLLLLMAILSNVRGLFAAPMLSVLLAFVLLGFVGKLRLKKFHAVVFVLSVPVAVFALAQLSDLALAMRAARANRGSVGAVVIMRDTMATFSDKKYLSSYRDELSAGLEYRQYNEFYVSSPFLSRFVITKFIDNTLSYIPEYTPGDIAELRSFTKQRIWASLPSPLLTLLRIPVSKEFATSISMGDYMYYLANGGILGGFKTGSLIGNGVAVFGYWVFGVIFIFAIPVFCLFDSFARVTQAFGLAPRGVQHQVGNIDRKRIVPGQIPTELLAVSPLVFIFIYDYFIYWTAEGMSTLIVGIIRGFVQKAVFYYVFCKIGEFFLGRNNR